MEIELRAFACAGEKNSRIEIFLPLYSFRKNMGKQFLYTFLKLLLFWILIFDFQRILFSIHLWEKLEGISVTEWLLSFVYSFRLDLATAGALTILPWLVFAVWQNHPQKWTKRLFYAVVLAEVLLVALVHSGEINAYGEWNHKLTSRVFMHLGNPDEVVRTADSGMTFWYIVYLLIEGFVGWKLLRWMFPLLTAHRAQNPWINLAASVLFFAFGGAFSFLFLRGGLQPIPININAAMYSKNPVTNDISVNSLYFFAKSYLMYNRIDIDAYMPKIDPNRAKQLYAGMNDYPREHDRYFLTKKRPNIVVVVLESWTADAISCLSSTEGSTPNFDKLAREGVLFSQVHAVSGTSEIGNAAIFSGFPALPEVSITMQPEKHRKIRSLNQDLKSVGYRSHYLFSGDLKYGNIGGYFLDHGFDVVKDENDFPAGIKRGKLNYYDADLYRFFLKEINQTKEPFLHCAFTGSTHSPYDHPQTGKQPFRGVEENFMNSIVYADACLGSFIRSAKKQPWFDNTLFVFVADHGHASPLNQNPSSSAYNRIPLLFWGNVVDKAYRGKTIETLGSQADLAATLLYQMGLSCEGYPWSKDLMNPSVPEFALHTITRGYGWIVPSGNYTYQMQTNFWVEDNLPPLERKKEVERSHAYLTEVYRYFKSL